MKKLVMWDWQGHTVMYDYKFSENAKLGKEIISIV